jgi:hypothetical protein
MLTTDFARDAIEASEPGSPRSAAIVSEPSTPPEDAEMRRAGRISRACVDWESIV